MAKAKPAPVVKAKPEPVAKVKPEPVAKPEPKPQPIVEAKPKPAPAPAPKAKPAAPVFMKDAEFTSTFVDIANSMSEEGNNSSSDWREKIITQSGTTGTMQVLVVEGSSEPKVMSIENFKKQQLIATTPYVVNGVKDIKRKKDNSIYQITIVVTKN